ncbi:allergin-1 isoform X2 [Phoca vitulina]|uniref:allergin-1 isoform X2 n=1 Tax=Phoca vitulina TaxID=9720 RepID=UPI0013962B78|nr:allergin-1 isoform X2 [Phoca vitulina]
MWRQLNKLFFWGIFSSLTLQKAALDCDTRRINKLLSPSLDSEAKVVMRGQNVSLICSNQNKSLQITYFLFRREKHLRTHDGKDPVITPVLNIHVINTETDRHIILRCSSFNGSLPITYTFFEKDIAISPPISKHVREPAEFNVSKNNTGEKEEYRCKAENKLPDHERYSQPVSINPPPGRDGCPFCLQLLLPGLLLVLIVIIPVLAFWILPKYKARKAMRDKAPGDYGNTAREVRIYANICENQAGKESAQGLEPRQCVPTAQDGTGRSQEIHYATPVFQEVAPRVHEACNDCKTGYIYSELIF